MSKSVIDQKFKSTLEYLYSKLPMFERQGPTAFKKDLTNIKALCQHLGNPQNKFKSIHIAGTNGKGSVSHILSSVLQEAGYKTGMYISPHYKDFRERIRTNHRLINKKFVIDFVDNIKPSIDLIRPSFFEITVAMAFDYFAQNKVELAVIETGLGGRLDSTNIITPILSIITNISMDHQNILGDTLEKIAFEKAGIIKARVPVLIGEYQSKVYPVFKTQANTLQSPIFCASKFAQVSYLSDQNKYLYTHTDKSIIPFKITFNNRGPYQLKNINTVIQSVRILNGLLPQKIPNTILLNGFKNISMNAPLIGRWQILNHSPFTIADAAHNLAGIIWLWNEIKKSNFKNIHCVFGTVRDKDIAPVLKYCSKKAKYYFVNADIPRAMPSNLLLNEATKAGLSGSDCGSVQNGYKMAKKLASKEDLILITGSIFVISEIL